MTIGPDVLPGSSEISDLSTAAERQRAHAAIAARLPRDSDERAWHLAESRIDADEETAAALEGAARRAIARDDPDAAVEALRRAGELSPAIGDRQRRLAEAAFVGADRGGSPDGVARLLADADRHDPWCSRTMHGAIAAAHSRLALDGDVDGAFRVLDDAIARHPGANADDDALIEALIALAEVCAVSGREHDRARFADRVVRLGPGAPRLLAAHAQAAGGADGLLARHARADIRGLVRDLSDAGDDHRAVRLAAAAAAYDVASDARSAALRTLERRRRGHGSADPVRPLMILVEDDVASGRWSDAIERAEAGLRECRAIGSGIRSSVFEYHLAVLAGARGDGERADGALVGLDRISARTRSPAVAGHAMHVRVLTALAQRDWERAYWLAASTIEVSSPVERTTPVLRLGFDLVEAAVRTGHVAEGVAQVARMRSADVQRISPRLAMLFHASQGLLAEGPRAAAHFSRAVGVREASRFPFELARVRLAYGERLRRSLDRSGGRAQLRAALETFERLGATPWAERAREELRAAREPGFVAPSDLDADLTPQERAIADLAATGLSNREIGERLFLSPRTVGGHLYRAFPKLGVTTRAALRDALAQPPRQRSGVG